MVRAHEGPHRHRLETAWFPIQIIVADGRALPPAALCQNSLCSAREYFATGLPWLFDLLKSSAFTGSAINFFWFGSFMQRKSQTIGTAGRWACSCDPNFVRQRSGELAQEAITSDVP
jgi:hypothetical protein